MQLHVYKMISKKTTTTSCVGDVLPSTPPNVIRTEAAAKSALISWNLRVRACGACACVRVCLLGHMLMSTPLRLGPVRVGPNKPSLDLRHEHDAMGARHRICTACTARQMPWYTLSQNPMHSRLHWMHSAAIRKL
jgi:hypothetical protein